RVPGRGLLLEDGHRDPRRRLHERAAGSFDRDDHLSCSPGSSQQHRPALGGPEGRDPDRPRPRRPPMRHPGRRRRIRARPPALRRAPQRPRPARHSGASRRGSRADPDPLGARRGDEALRHPAAFGGFVNSRVLLADDHVVVRQGLKALLEREGFDVVAEASDGREASRLARELSPDIAILDLAMPLLNGIETGRAILRGSPGVRTIALTVHTETHYVLAALEAGFSGYVLKSQAAEQLVRSI